jgi:hypothetical protein
MPTEDLEPLAYALHNLFRSTFRVVMAHVGDVTTSCDVTTCKLYSNYLYDRTCWFKIFIRVGSRRGSAIAHHTPLSTRVFPTARHMVTMVMPSRSSAVLAKSVRRQAIEVGTPLHALSR